MIPLYTEHEFNNCKSREKLSLKCEQCNKIFYKTKHQIQDGLNPNNHHKLNTCSYTCAGIIKNKQINVNCKQCNRLFSKKIYEIKKHPNNFCSRSCAATQNNTHKTTGTRRSKLEKWLEQQLTNLYPNLEIHFNQKSAINSELDIYIPSLKLAIEINGILHYESIFGSDKLNQIQLNDKRKIIQCEKNNIKIWVIDTSNHKYVTEKSSKKYLNQIINIINGH